MLHHNHSETVTQTVAMDTLHYTGHISTTDKPNDMIKRPLESHDQVLYFTSPTQSTILALSSATSYTSNIYIFTTAPKPLQ